MGKRFIIGQELCRMDDVRMRMFFIPYQKAFSHNLVLLRSFLQSYCDRVILFSICCLLIHPVALVFIAISFS